MKFLLDVCVASRSLEAKLTSLGHEVVSAVTIDRRASDEALLGLAVAQGQILLTADKDYGELVFVRRLPHGTIVRFVEMSVEDQVRAMEQLLERNLRDLRSNALITATPGRIRVRRGKPSGAEEAAPGGA